MTPIGCQVRVTLSKERMKHLRETLTELEQKGLHVTEQKEGRIEGTIPPDLLENFADVKGVTVYLNEVSLDPREWEKA
jgi:hypothetical protein